MLKSVGVEIPQVLRNYLFTKSNQLKSIIKCLETLNDGRYLTNLSFFSFV